MTTGQLKNKMRRLRETREEEAEEEAGELNLVPYLDIVTNVVIFLLASVTYTLSLSNLNTSLPSYGAGTGSAPEGPPPLNLTVSIGANGFVIAGSGAVMQNEVTGTVPTIPKKPGSSELPWNELVDKLREIKNQFPNENNVILNANPDILYETIVKT